MKSHFAKTIILTAILLFALTAMARCSEDTVVPLLNVDLSSPAPSDKAHSGFKMGIDTYLGASNMSGRRMYSDGMWAGAGNSFPSMAYLEWDGTGDRTARVSFGTGSMYTCSDSTQNQPIEAYIQMPIGKATVTVGKYYIPFAQQEWFYESKPGVMAQWSGDKASLSLSTNYSLDSHKQFAYARGAYKVAEDAEIGLSYALGSGFCSESEFERGFAADANIGYKGLRLYVEYNLFSKPNAADRFSFVSGKLYYEKLGAWQPFVGSFTWQDDTDFFGSFRSTVVGLDYQATPSLALEAAVSTTSDSPVSWLQVHWTWEKSVSVGL
jgi:hypothetical protein